MFIRSKSCFEYVAWMLQVRKTYNQFLINSEECIDTPRDNKVVESCKLSKLSRIYLRCIYCMTLLTLECWVCRKVDWVLPSIILLNTLLRVVLVCKNKALNPKSAIAIVDILAQNLTASRSSNPRGVTIAAYIRGCRLRRYFYETCQCSSREGKATDFTLVPNQPNKSWRSIL